MIIKHVLSTLLFINIKHCHVIFQIVVILFTVDNPGGGIGILSDLKQCVACADDHACDTLAGDDDEDADSVKPAMDI